MPEPPTSGVNGQVLSVPALQASMSMLSFAPAATMFDWIGLMATAGSFCLFWEKIPSLLSTVTSVSGPGAAPVGVAEAIDPTSVATTATRRSRGERLIWTPPFELPHPPRWGCGDGDGIEGTRSASTKQARANAVIPGQTPSGRA